MRPALVRTVSASALAVLLLGCALAPSAMAAKPKPKPKPISGSYVAAANPDPTSTNPVDNNPCNPTLPGAKDHHAFTIPAAGTLTVRLENKLDWSLALRAADGTTLASSDGGLPTDKEVITYVAKAKKAVFFDACNFLGEPSVGVRYTFVFK